MRFSPTSLGIGHEPLADVGDGGEVVDRVGVDLAISDLWDRGTTGVFEGPDEIIVGFETESEAADAARFIDSQLPLRAPAIVAQAAQPEEWADDSVNTVEVWGGEKRFSLSIKAGAAFGHGEHQTTRLVLDQLIELIDERTTVLDIGCGTGVLAIAAARAGAAEVVAIDNDPAAVAMTVENAARNEVSIRSGPETIDQVMAGRSAGFDLVMMNVLLPVHTELATSARSAVAGGGQLLTAGYLEEQTDQLVACYIAPSAGSDRDGHPRTGASVAAEATLDGWASHRFRMPTELPGQSLPLGDQ